MTTFHTRYEALSYAWGDTQSTKPILLDGFLVQVTDNLESALRQLRRGSQPVRLWVDAICINQKDLEEKQCQVRHMGKIYERAQRVIAWLGEAADGSDAAMDALASIGESAYRLGFQAGCDEAIAQKWSRINIDKQVLEDVINDPLVELYHRLRGEAGVNTPLVSLSVVQILNRSWWRRLWVIQEAVLACDLVFVCGNRQVAGDHFAAVEGACQSLSRAFQLRRVLLGAVHATPAYDLNVIEFIAKAVPLLRIRKAVRKKSSLLGNMSLADILHFVSVFGPPFEATDPRDNIFAIMWMASDVHKLEIRPDYRATCQEVYVHTTMRLLLQGHLKVLAFCQFPHALRGLPTWVADWSRTLLAPLQPRDRFYKTGHAQAAPSAHQYVLDFLQRGDDWTLRLAGAKLSNICSLAQTWNELNYIRRKYRGNKYRLEKKSRRWFQNLLTFVELSRDELPHRRNLCRADRSAIASALVRTSCADQEYVITTNTIERMATNSISNYSAAILNDEPRQLSRLEQYLQAVQFISRNRRPFFTDSGQLGLGPSCVQIDDILVLVLGADMPYILREGEDGKYRLVGECYVDGIMDGQALDDATFECFPIV
ncbi:MAG: hypothetical protein MMC23_007936 [Stictis urceolatum]|nr:hypothetical protein [Stictis urceolata]